MSELTPWFPGDVKPARAGVYQTEDGFFSTPQNYFNRWDGVRWYYGGDTKWDAQESTMAWRDAERTLLRWRGLASDPKAKA